MKHENYGKRSHKTKYQQHLNCSLIPRPLLETESEIETNEVSSRGSGEFEPSGCRGIANLVSHGFLVVAREPNVS